MIAQQERGYVQVYTGDGKGKTTAALGLILRALGAGWPVFLGQFAKGRFSSELAALKSFACQLTVRQFGRTAFVERVPQPADRDAARRGWQECCEAVASGVYRLVVLDEANVATMCGLLPIDDLLALIDSKPAHVELVLTGRWADPRILERADLVTEMRAVKHYYEQGVAARVGVEQ